MTKRSMLVASPVSDAVGVIRKTLNHGHRIDVADNASACFEMFKQKHYAFSFIDLDFLMKNQEQEQKDLNRILDAYFQAFPEAVIVALTSSSRIGEAVKAVKSGLSGYLCYPLDEMELWHLTQSILETQNVSSAGSRPRESADGEWKPLTETNSPLMHDIFEKIDLVAPTRTTVLLTGETGTGKSLLARLIHTRSKRSTGPFISVHCGAIPETLVESELFGHEKGAFTGATRSRLGKFQSADQGTIFLDEIGTIDPPLQVKLLQVLQEGQFTRVGSEAPVKVDVRVVAATNADLPTLCQEGDFRQDLYYRLNGFVIEVPPLRDRPEDIPHLVDRFITRYNQTNDREIRGVSDTVLSALKTYHWPGNIRELENLIDQACIVEKGAILSPAGFPPKLFLPAAPQQNHDATSPCRTLDEMRQKTLENADRQYLEEILRQNRGAVMKAAETAGVTPRHFRNLLKKYGLRKEDYK